MSTKSIKPLSTPVWAIAFVLLLHVAANAQVERRRDYIKVRHPQQ